MVNDIDTEPIWGLLRTIPDPEIPSVSIVDLGIVRDVQFEDEQIQITITPTYSGCPAMAFMKDEIIRLLKKEGIPDFNINVSLAPPWTTDWMNDSVKAKLKQTGIAPPESKIFCPQCGSEKTKVISEFGSTACKALYKCKECQEPFHSFKQI